MVASLQLPLLLTHTHTVTHALTGSGIHLRGRTTLVYVGYIQPTGSIEEDALPVKPKQFKLIDNDPNSKLRYCRATATAHIGILEWHI